MLAMFSRANDEKTELRHMNDTTIANVISVKSPKDVQHHHERESSTNDSHDGTAMLPESTPCKCAANEVPM